MAVLHSLMGDIYSQVMIQLDQQNGVGAHNPLYF